MNFVTEEKFKNIIESLSTKIEDLKESFYKYSTELDNHENNSAIHSYEKEDYDVINDFIANAERIISASSTFKDQLDKLLDKDTLSSFITIYNNIESLNKVISNQNIIINYILKHSNPEELKNLKSKQQSLEKLNPVHKYEITKVTEVNKVIENTDRTYDSNKVIQDEYHRFVTDKQIKDWSNAINILNNLLDKINYTKNTKIVNIQDIPFATTEQGGLMSFDDKRTLKEVSDKLNKPLVSWSTSDTSSPSYIMNRPDALPANGGDSNTVNGKSAKELTKTFNTSIGTSDRCDFIINKYSDLGYFLKMMMGNDIWVENNTYIISSTAGIQELIIDFNRSTIILDDKVELKFFNCTLKNAKFDSDSVNGAIIRLSNCTLRDCTINGNIKLDISDNNKITDSLITPDKDINILFDSNILSNNTIRTPMVIPKGGNRNIISNNIISKLSITGGSSTLVNGNIINEFNLSAGFKNTISNNIIGIPNISNVSKTHNTII